MKLRLAFLLVFLLAGCGDKTTKSEEIETFKASDFVVKNMGEPGVWLEDPHNFTPTKGDTLRDSAMVDPDFLNPVLSLRKSAKKIEELLFDKILGYDESLNKIEPRLAESWSFSKEGLAITFTLRKGVFFHPVLRNKAIEIPAREMTTKDVEYTVKQILNPDNKSILKYYFSNFESFRIFDDYTFQVEYSDIRATNFTAWTLIPVLPRHIFEEGDVALVNSKNLDTPVGTGPFMFESWKRGREVALVKWERYWNGPANLDRYVLQIIPDKDYAFQKLLREEIDVMELTLEQFKDKSTVPEFENSYRKVALYTRSYDFIGYNQSDGPEFLRLANVRRAITMALDREKIIRMVCAGMGVVVTGPSHIHSWGYDNYIDPLPYSPAKAVELLEGEGWDNLDPDNVRYKIIGGKKVRLDFRLMTHGDSEPRKDTLNFVRQELGKVGFLVRPWVISTWDMMIKKFIMPKKFDAFLSGWEVGVEPDVYSMWHSSQSKYGFNHISYSNPDLDLWLEKFRSNMDRKERQIASWRIHKIIHENQPYTFLYMPRTFVAVHRRFKNLRISKSAYDLYPVNFKDWFSLPEGRLKK